MAITQIGHETIVAKVKTFDEEWGKLRKGKIRAVRKLGADTWNLKFEGSFHPETKEELKLELEELVEEAEQIKKAIAGYFDECRFEDDTEDEM